MQSNKKVSERGSVEKFDERQKGRVAEDLAWWDQGQAGTVTDLHYKPKEVDGNKIEPECDLSTCEGPCEDCTCDTSTVAQHSAWDEQIGGDHYKDFAIQPTEFIMKNKLNFLEGCIIKRICRYKKKGDGITDLKKIKHEIDMIIELEGLE